MPPDGTPQPADLVNTQGLTAREAHASSKTNGTVTGSQRRVPGHGAQRWAAASAETLCTLPRHSGARPNPTENRHAARHPAQRKAPRSRPHAPRAISFTVTHVFTHSPSAKCC